MTFKARQRVVRTNQCGGVGVIIPADNAPRENAVLVRWGNLRSGTQDEWCNVGDIRVATLTDHLPYQFTGGEYDATRAFKFRNCEVFEVHDSRDKPWPGTRKNVMNWYVTEQGFAIGWNEGVRGWSFEVIQYKADAE